MKAHAEPWTDSSINPPTPGQEQTEPEMPVAPLAPVALPDRLTLPFVPVTWMIFSRSRSSTCRRSTTP